MTLNIHHEIRDERTSKKDILNMMIFFDIHLGNSSGSFWLWTRSAFSVTPFSCFYQHSLYCLSYFLSSCIYIHTYTNIYTITYFSSSVSCFASTSHIYTCIHSRSYVYIHVRFHAISLCSWNPRRRKAKGAQMRGNSVCNREKKRIRFFHIERRRIGSLQLVTAGEWKGKGLGE